MPGKGGGRSWRQGRRGRAELKLAFACVYACVLGMGSFMPETCPATALSQPAAVLRQNNIGRRFPRKDRPCRAAGRSLRSRVVSPSVLRCTITPGQVKLDPDTWTVLQNRCKEAPATGRKGG